jgi:ATP:corrinoid adenosyltransferase
MVVLGEIGTLVGQETSNGEEIIRLVLSRPKGLHVLLTARDVPEALVAAADLVTETKELMSRIG